MTMSDQFDEEDRLDREAHYWVTLLVSGDASTADADALRRWRQTSPAHDQAFARARRRWKHLGQAGQSMRERGEIAPWTPPQPMLSRRALFGGAVAGAASLAAYAVVKPPLGVWPSLSEMAADYRTGTGEQRRITVAGDVSIRLNTQTSLAVAGSDEDEFQLIAGEASFAIPARGRSLAVVAGDGRCSARKGRFDIRHLGAGVSVTCVDGEVEVQHAHEIAKLNRGQQLYYDAHGLQGASAADLDVSTAWQDGVPPGLCSSMPNANPFECTVLDTDRTGLPRKHPIWVLNASHKSDFTRK